MRKELKEKKLIESFRLFLWDWFGEKFSKAFKVIAISCLQFGDTGKGKFIHLLTWLWAHIVARSTGGDNAGHTFYHKGREIVLHLLPCGMPFDNKGVVNIIGSGVAFYPKAAVDEIKMLLSLGLTCDNLKIALNAKLLLPHHILLDRLGEMGAGKEKIGSTGKGIQPCYTDFIARKGLVLNDVLNPEIFRKKLRASMRSVQAMLSNHGPSGKKVVKEIMSHPHLEDGLYYSEDGTLNEEAIIAKYIEYGEYLRKYIFDTDEFLRGKLGKANILLEGAQGYLLSIDHGTYPYVTSSDCSPAGLAKGAGLRETDIDLSFGIIKGFYETRVGCGPFPTEMGGKTSASWCNNGATKEMEDAAYINATVNDQNEIRQGVAIRRKGGEYGATTKRPRRTGWLDLVLLRHALDSGANNIILTKLDILTGVKEIKVCYAYRYEGPDYNYGAKVLKSGEIILKGIMDPEVLDYCVPLYTTFPGWNKSIKKAKYVLDLPDNLVRILKYIFEEADVRAKPRIISVGPGTEETIFVGVNDLRLFSPEKK